jgi:hypothetical protein|tara:strand:- start:812 stop:1210 length:399 start_codon:yes stop_codon:yes gene_type:complete
MSQAEMFANLGAPLNNVRWSWGSVRESDGAVFLRVWQDGTRKIDGKRFVWISDENPPEGDLGANERLHHVTLINSGKACYLIMCQAVDTKAAPRQVQSFNAKEVFCGGEVLFDDGAYWIELKGRVPVKQVIV